MNKKILFLVPFLALSCAPTGENSATHDHAPLESAKPKASPLYQCPMHPSYTSDKPGDCPICGMRLVPIKSKGGKETKEDGDKTPSDRSEVSISEKQEQLIGVRTEKVMSGRLEIPIRASGRVAYDPDLYAALAEYREARRGSGEQVKGTVPEMSERASSLLNSARLRLRQMGLSDLEIAEWTNGNRKTENLLGSGDEKSVWIYAQIYSDDSPVVKVGDALEASLSAVPGKTFKGKITSIDAILDHETRTLKVRAEIENDQAILKPEMYVDVLIHADLGQVLLIPESAVIYTGTRELAFVKTGEGTYSPRGLQLGRKGEAGIELLAGVTEGEEVVTEANFLIDSESRLKAALKQVEER